jgi:hypothetical protein
MSTLSPQKLNALLKKHNFDLGAVYSTKGHAKVLEIISDTRIFFVEVSSKYQLSIAGVEVVSEPPFFEVQNGFGARTATRISFKDRGYRRCDSPEEPEIETMISKVDELESLAEDEEFTAQGYEELKTPPTKVIIPEDETELVFLDDDGKELSPELAQLSKVVEPELVKVDKKPKSKPLREYPVFPLVEFIKRISEMRDIIEEVSEEREKEVEKTIGKTITLLSEEAERRKEMKTQLARLKKIYDTTNSEKVKKETIILLMEIREKLEKSFEDSLKIAR